ncbi:hypothetical protein, partial [Sutterella wadsworthensis]|uniref:hypothetical protein n=2 Tax=Sutterella wadsworthensis TaxID=40545 RepID=UPI003AB95842
RKNTLAQLSADFARIDSFAALEKEAKQRSANGRFFPTKGISQYDMVHGCGACRHYRRYCSAYQTL